MNYQITESEFNQLESCMKQIDLMTDFCSLIEGHQSITIDGLQSFLCAQQEVLYATIKAATTRMEAQQQINRENGAMQCFDWVHALRVVGGDALHTPSGTERRITERLALAARVDEGMQLVFNEWVVALGRAAKQEPPCAAPATVAKHAAKGRKRDRLVTA